jgi:hypothetical protein
VWEGKMRLAYALLSWPNTTGYSLRRPSSEKMVGR